MLASQGTSLLICFSWSLNFKSKELFIIAAVSYQPLWLNWFLLYLILAVISSADCTWNSKFKPKVIMFIDFDKIFGCVLAEPMQNLGLSLRLATLLWRPKFTLGLFLHSWIWKIFHVIYVQLCEISVSCTIWASGNWLFICNGRMSHVPLSVYIILINWYAWLKILKILPLTYLW